MDNEQWGLKLKADYEKKTGDRRNIRLPEPNEILFGGEEDLVTITMNEKAVVANLQTDAAAFESWSLALKVWCEVAAVELRWNRVTSGAGSNDWCHYQRFLYRAERFSTLCGGWFQLREPALLSDSQALDNGPLLLNVPGDRLPFDEPIELGSESDVEKSLLRSERFKQYFRLASGKVDRQLPVGLFRGHVAKENRIFTGGKSAIDLVGIGDANGTLSIFELKTGDNIPVGILSELFFYTSVIRDAIPAPARFQFDPRKPSRGSGVSAGDVMRCSSINAVFLADQFHPLVEHRNLIDRLNKAAADNWNKEPGRVPVSFRAVHLKRSTRDFDFKDVTA